jgi:DNA-binding transcriptional regulator YbjK
MSEGIQRQARGETRRRQVIEATLRLLARGGPRAVTHRAVASEAETSVRATTYYFESRDALLIEALRHYAETAIERFDSVAESLESTVGGGAIPSAARPALLAAAAGVLADTAISDIFDDPVGLVAEYELVLEIGRNPELEPDYRRWQDRLEEMLRCYAELFGSSDPALDARVVLATLRGLEIEALARPSEKPDRDDLTRVFERLLTGLLAADGGVAGGRI